MAPNIETCRVEQDALEEENAQLRAQLIAARGLLRGMLGLVELIHHREPDLITNHRYVDAQAWLARYDGDD